jgi:enolase
MEGCLKGSVGNSHDEKLKHMSKIKYISAREILNSKGNPTIEATVVLDDGSIGIAACPSGTSTGTYEAVELRDNDKTRFGGLGVIKAITNIEKTIAPKLIGMDANKQNEIDQTMIALDGTENKANLGANAILSISMAVAKAAAQSVNKPLYQYLHELFNDKTSIKIPTPAFNIINGGLHGSGTLDFQEFFVVPATTYTYSQSLNIGIQLYHALKDLLKLNGYSILVGDEGGFEPQLNSNYDVLDFLVQVINATNLQLGTDVFLGLDTAANSFLKDETYHIKDKQKPLSAKELTEYYQQLVKEFHIVYLEDPLSEDDWDDWAEANKLLGNQTMVIGDDLTATNPKRLATAIEKKAMNAILIKLNQIGSVSETIQVIQQAKSTGLKVIVSHRSGETNDDFVADFGVAVNADYVKFGAPARGERVAKYNRLLQIEQELKK